MGGGKPVPAVPAASVLLVRDGGAGLQVLLLERHPHARFAAGATVFPGGKVDPADASDATRRACSGVDGLEAAAVALRAGAIRELFEECGILLARPWGDAEFLDARRVSDLGRRHRRELEGGQLSLGELAARENLELAADLLVPFAHWITPEPQPRRFDTHFFLVEAPVDQTEVHHRGESVRLMWMTPAAALEEAARGRSSMMFPTRMNLAKLGRSRSVAEALELARRERVVTVLPRVEAGAAGPIVRIPAEAGYGVVETPLEELLPRRV